ncbi:MAG: hypothetical protein AAF805_06055, partial [Planctomycetota bacterium]
MPHRGRRRLPVCGLPIEGLLKLLGVPTRRSTDHRERDRPRPLRLMRLERRRVLSADFALAGGGLLLDGFDAAGDSQLAVSETADAYHFRLTQDGQAESWNAPLTGAPAGATVDGDTLSIEKAALTDGVSIEADPAASLRVRLDGVDFSPLGGSVSIAGAAEIGGSTAVATVAPTAGFVFASAPSGLTLGSLAMSG